MNRTREYYQLRIDKLRKRGEVMNSKLIKKLERQLRNLSI